MRIFSILEGLALGAGLMYVLDPESGRRRRSVAQDQLQKQARQKQEALNVMQRDFTNRTQGMINSIKANRSMGDVASDDIIEQRVRSAIGRVCTHPRAIHCTVHDGEVTLTGPILTNEVQGVVQCVKHVRGVTKVTNKLEVVTDTAGVPGLQGGSKATARNTTWNPATGLVMTSVGGLMSLYGLARRGPVGLIMGLVGTSMITKAFWDTEHRFMPQQGQQGQGHQDALPGSQQQATTFGGGTMDDQGSVGSYESIGSFNDNTSTTAGMLADEGQSIDSYEGMAADETGVAERTRRVPLTNDDVDVI